MLHLLIQTCAAAMATIGFSLLFGVPARYYPSCALIGGVSWLAYLLLLPYSSVSIATFAATVIVILMSRWFAVRKRCPVTIFLISGIIPLVPGANLPGSLLHGHRSALPGGPDRFLMPSKWQLPLYLGLCSFLKFRRRYFRSAIIKLTKNTNFYRYRRNHYAITSEWTVIDPKSGLTRSWIWSQATERSWSLEMI